MTNLKKDHSILWIKHIMLKIKNNEAICYLIAGGLTTLISLFIYYGLTFTVLNPTRPVQLQLANIVSFVISVIFAYVVNKKYVFKSTGKHRVEFVKFISSRLITLGIDMSIMFIFVSILKIDDRIIKIVSQIVVIVLNYIFSKKVVFRKKN